MGVIPEYEYIINLLIGLIVAIVVGRYIIKGYSATGILFVGGLILLITSISLGRSILPEAKSTGYAFTDIFEFIKGLLSSRAADLGMMIMILCGFAAYMSHIGANNVVVKLASRPLKYIKSPYILMIGGYFVACLMSLAVSSAAGLGVLLMGTLFPLMVNMGISRGAAAAICASPAAIILSPTSGDVVLAAEKAGMGGEALVDFAFGITLPISLMAIAAIAVAHFFWQPYLDKKEKLANDAAKAAVGGVSDDAEKLEVKEIETTAPSMYFILPFMPIIGVLIFSGKLSFPFKGQLITIPNLSIITILIICILLTALIEFVRGFDAKKVFAGLDVTYRGMGDAFVSVVMLLVAAGVFAEGLNKIGFTSGLIHLAETLGGGAFFMMIVLVVVTMLAAMATGSGNAPFYAFVEFIPTLAAKMGINPAYLIIPMLQASNVGRSMSPVSGVVVATSGMAKVSPFEVVKRTSVPMIVGILVVIIATQFKVPLIK